MNTESHVSSIQQPVQEELCPERSVKEQEQQQEQENTEDTVTTGISTPKEPRRSNHKKKQPVRYGSYMEEIHPRRVNRRKGCNVEK